MSLVSKNPDGSRRDRTDRLPGQIYAMQAESGNTKAGALNPTWVEWLMGYPTGWTVLEDSETPSSRKSSNGSLDE